MERTVRIETSARHVHLSPADLAVLFGEGAALTPKRGLSQPGQFLSEERVRLVGTKAEMDHVAILGPTRSYTQVELSFTDARKLGVEAPVRMSGDLTGSGSIRVIGPKGALTLKEGVIAAKRHIHLSPEDAAAFGVRDQQIVRVKVGGPRALTFDETVVRVSPQYRASMHIDTDEANAAGLSSGAGKGEIVG